MEGLTKATVVTLQVVLRELEALQSLPAELLHDEISQRIEQVQELLEELEND